MAAQTEPRSGLFYGWDLGENGWNVGMDANLLRLGRFGFHLSVISKSLSAPPVSPEIGDGYIIADDATGDWTGSEGLIAIWNEVWVYGVPEEGWISFVQETKEIVVFTDSNWVTPENPNVNHLLLLSSLGV